MIISLYTKLINTIYQVNKKINHKILLCLRFFCTFTISYFYLSRLADFKYNFSDHTNLTFTFILFILAVINVDENIKNVEIKKILLFLYFVFGVGLIVIGSINCTDKMYRYFGIQLLFIFPMFILQSRENKMRLMDNFAISFCVICLLYYVYCWIAAKNGYLSFAENGAFCATTINQNTFANYEIVCLISSVLCMLKYVKSKIYFLSTIAFSISFLFIIMTACRAVFLALICCVSAIVLYLYKTYKANDDKKTLTKVIIKKVLIVLISVLVINNLNVAMISMNNNSKVFNSTLVNIGDYSNLLSERIKSGSSSKRFDIWVAYLKRIKLFGNKQNIINDIDFIKEMNHGIYQPAHNTIIEISFWFGIILGLLYSLLLAFVFFRMTIRALVNKHNSKYLLVVQCMTFPFFIISFLDNITIPILCPITLLFYILL